MREGVFLRLTVRTRIAVDLIAAVSLSMILVGFATLAATGQLLRNGGQDALDQWAASLAAQVGRMRVPGRTLDHPDNRVLLRSLLSDEVFGGRTASVVVRSAGGAEAWRIDAPVGDDALIARVGVSGGGTLVLSLENAPGEEAVSALARLLLGLIMGSVALVSFIAWWLLSRSVGQPVARLIQSVEKVRTDATELPPLGEAGSELAALHKAIERMRLRSERARADLGERHEALQQAHDDLLTAKRATQRAEHLAGVGRLAAGVAHEVGNPLSALLGFVQLLRDGRIPEAKQAEVLERLEAELLRIRDIIGSLLTYARPARPTLTPVILRRVVEPTVALVHADRAFRSVEVRVELPAQLPAVLADEGGLRQVLVNLCLNAAEAASEGEDAVVSISARSDEKTVTLAVEDSGGGIDKSLGETIFEPFVTTKEVGRGTGLGLSVCQGIVQSWDGKLLASNSSTLGGARFELQLQRAQGGSP